MTDHAHLHPDHRALLKALRQILKTRKLTYARLAKMLKVSEVTVKRWLLGQACSLDKIFQICQVLNISFFDLASLAGKAEEEDYFLTESQEHFFAKKPALFGIFKMIHQGMDTKKVAAFWELSAGQLYSVLRLLEKQDLLEVLPGNNIRLKTRGNLRMSHQGPFAKAVLRPHILQFLDHIDDVLENDDVCMHSAEVELSPTSISEMVDEIHALGAKYRARALRDKSSFPAESLNSVRWLFGFAPYQTNWRQYKL
jgi:transcriptional regulator with XRE-family HTH domain